MLYLIHDKVELKHTLSIIPYFIYIRNYIYKGAIVNIFGVSKVVLLYVNIIKVY